MDNWRKSSYPGEGDGDNRVEIATSPTHTAVRDSKAPARATPTSPADAFTPFLDALKTHSGVGGLRPHGDGGRSTAEAGRASPSTNLAGAFPFGVFFGGLTSLVPTAAIGRVWAACDIGGGAAANSLTLLLLAPLIRIATAILLGVLYGVVGGRHRRAVLTAGLLLTVCCTWFLVTWLGVPDSCPAPVCPGSVPPRWPDFIPA